jgi:hypothetical protein
VEAHTGTRIVVAWAPLVTLSLVWLVTALYMRMSPATVKRWLEAMARRLPDDDRK